MRCFEDYQDDRICDMCELKKQCMSITKRKKEARDEYYNNVSHCRFRGEAYEDRDFYYTCSKQGRRCDCNPTEYKDCVIKNTMIN